MLCLLVPEKGINYYVGFFGHLKETLNDSFNNFILLINDHRGSFIHKYNLGWHIDFNYVIKTERNIRL